MRRLVCAAFLALLTIGFCNPVYAEELSVRTREGTRSAMLLPAPRPRAPTVIVLHGALVTAEQTASWYGFADAVEKRGFAAVFPRGIGMLWNDGRHGAWGSEADDVGFLRQLAQDLVVLGTADPARLYLAGVSNGGMMTLRMLCEASEPFAGAATVIASMPTGVGANCRLRRSMPVVMLNGTADSLIPYKGGAVGMIGSMQGSVWPVERTAAFLARRNGCALGPTKSAVAGSADADSIRVVKLAWRECATRRAVTLYRVEGGGHQVYGHTNYFPMILGPGADQISAPEIIMSAFARIAAR